MDELFVCFEIAGLFLAEWGKASLKQEVTSGKRPLIFYANVPGLKAS